MNNRKIHIDSSTVAQTAPMQPFNKPSAPKFETNGLVSSDKASIDNPSVASVTAPKAPTSVPEVSKTSASKLPERQTHGAVLPRGPIMSVSQLTSGRSLAKGSVTSFDTLAEYSDHLNTLTWGELRRHALEEAKIVPIDDRNRLIRRLEGEWSGGVARGSRATQAQQMNSSKPYTQEQLDTQEAIRNKILKR